ncbi:gamma-butyrobetaine,2-oxoglutarate dioxygenase [Verticillium dahliae VdLs.17]|uniref:Gamma-butyrobetaine,2-oxoglutarate dioxygenase n=1 Tax=Verticillium dahliae (strain VdLs.17 / ATCC MYA-4575 / FGSC 10137) TaxID=498257 RepID=G2XGT0_VERDV|nr:gamma-butyrobetaine,2-oxoglutarate dioxygenase [Verticillium dahliae VdLs.17]EGY19028.1 gamma-butyrobetaine,2-oxoglutarate dioxygenase [Verticillium dahliae VdLs.17]KAH6693041.1 gamma-butyrobetaine,2-oxoglutarate dioxygenase [Verticillium dahliae]
MYARSRALRAVQGAASRHMDGLITRTPPTARCVRCLAPTTSFHTSSRLRQGEATGIVPKTATSTSSPPLVPASLKRRRAATAQPAAAVVCRVSAADPTLLTIEGPDLPSTEVPAGWLRDRCPQSTSPSSGNKNFATGEVPVDIAIESVRQDSEGNWEITWRNNIPRFVADGINTSVFTSGQLRRALHTEFASRDLAVLQHHTVPTASQWNRRTLYPREVSYADWMAGEGHFAAAETFYGNTWDVVSKPRAENVAYTSEYLGLHSDMLYLHSPPKLQFLHCLENKAVGGESLFSDAMRTAAEMMVHTPDLAAALAETNLGWHYDNGGFFYEQARPVFQGMGQLDAGTREVLAAGAASGHDTADAVARLYGALPTDVWWSPPFQTPLRAPTTPEARTRFAAWHAAASTFQHMLEEDGNMIRRRLREGDCVVFDNRRVLHGRTAFDPASGGRHLRGAYVGIDEWRSTIKRVERDYAVPEFLEARKQALRAWSENQ